MIALPGHVKRSLLPACALALQFAFAAGHAVAAGGTDSNPGTPPLVAASPTLPAAGPQLPGGGGSGVELYFTPSDENTTTTILFLVNTTDQDASVPLEAYNLNGSLTLTTTVPVPARNLVRVVSDGVSTVSATWQNPVLVNFTTFSTYVKITLPRGVLADGYVAMTPTGTYDPLANAPAMPLRFQSARK